MEIYDFLNNFAAHNTACVFLLHLQDGSLQFDVYLYLQYERHVQQASDEIIQVQCEPQDVVVSSRVVPAKPGGQLATRTITTTSTTEVNLISIDSAHIFNLKFNI